MDEEKITLAVGEGGLATKRIVETVFLPLLNNPILGRLEDSAIINIRGKNIAFTTDVFTVDPIFFPGGDIGKLAVCGTFNDLTAMGAKPIFVSACFILEEGLPTAELEKIASSFKRELGDIPMVASDTKVVPKGQGGKVYIAATGIGEVIIEVGLDKIEVGDEIVLSGDIARHASAIACVIENITPHIESDCASLTKAIDIIVKNHIDVHAMRDPTRGGLATVLVEIAEKTGLSFDVYEDKIPVAENVSALCNLFGYDPLYLACEGRMVFFVSDGEGESLVNALKTAGFSENASVIGKVIGKGSDVILKTKIGGERKIIMLEGAQLPRIC